jgi:hypothetical protein
MSECENHNEVLVNEIKERKDKLVIFAGAGIPTSTKIPAWKELLIGLAKELNDKKLEESISDDSDYPEKAQEIYEAFIKKENNDENTGEEKYYSAIRELLKTKDWDYSPSQPSIWHACKKVITTNFDSTFEDAYNEYCSYRFGDRPHPCLYIQGIVDLNGESISGGNNTLVYLHGNVTSKVIFKKTDYDTFYSNPGKTRKLTDFYKSLYGNKTLLFIGFSFNDKYILDMLRFVRKELLEDDKTTQKFYGNTNPVRKNIKHYAFMKDVSSEYEQKIEQLEEECSQNPKMPKKEKDAIKANRENLQKLCEDFEKLCEDLKEINVIPLKYKNHKDYRPWLNEISGPIENVSDVDDNTGSDSAFKRLN